MKPFPRAAHLGKPASRKEDVEQREVCTFLDKLGVLYCAIPNGGKRGKIEAKRMKGLGTKRGAPDLVIFKEPKRWAPWGAAGLPITPKWDKSGTAEVLRGACPPLEWVNTPRDPVTCENPEPAPWGKWPRGVAIEMKRTNGVPSDITPEQREWGRRIASEGWYWFAARGADEAIAELMRLGFGS